MISVGPPRPIDILQTGQAFSLLCASCTCSLSLEYSSLSPSPLLIDSFSPSPMNIALTASCMYYYPESYPFKSILHSDARIIFLKHSMVCIISPAQKPPMVPVRPVLKNLSSLYPFIVSPSKPVVLSLSTTDI